MDVSEECRKHDRAGVHGTLTTPLGLPALLRSQLIILNALALKLKGESRGDLKGRHFEAVFQSCRSCRAVIAKRRKESLLLRTLIHHIIQAPAVGDRE